MRLGHLLTITRVALTAAVFASSALVIDYQNPGSTAFCGAESSCGKVQRSDIGESIGTWIESNVWGGLTLPHLALFLFLIVLAVTFFLKTKLHSYLLAGMCGLGALFAAFLIYAQATIGAYCAYCMIVDAAAIVAGGASVALALGVSKQRGGLFSDLDESMQQATDTSSTIAWGIAGTALTALPFLFAKFTPSDGNLPRAIAQLQEPGKTVVVTFTDFECPHCRKLHQDTHEAVEKSGAVVHRFMVPLAFHFGARPAAAAYLCAPADKRDKVAHELYTMNTKNMTYDGVLEVLTAQAAGDADSLAQCLKAEGTEAKIESDSELFDAVGAKGLPTTWVGGTQVVGAASPTVIALLERGGSPIPSVQLPLWLMFVAAAAVVGGVVVWNERRPRRAPGGSAVPEPSDEDEPEDEPEPEAAAAPEPAEEREPTREVKRKAKGKAKRGSSGGPTAARTKDTQ